MASFFLNDTTGMPWIEKKLDSYLDEFAVKDAKLKDIAQKSGVSIRTIYRILALEPVTMQKARDFLIFLHEATREGGDDKTFCPFKEGLLVEKDKISCELAKRDELKFIADCENFHFGSHSLSQLEILDTWYSRNPNGFWIFRNRGKIILTLVLVPINNVDQAKIRFQKGEIKENDIKAKHINLPSEKSKVDSLYIESLATHDTCIEMRVKCLKFLCENIEEVLKSSCDIKNLTELYALAASPMGKNLMEHAKFEPYPNQQNPRKDGRWMYFSNKQRFLALSDVRAKRIKRALERKWVYNAETEENYQ